MKAYFKSVKKLPFPPGRDVLYAFDFDGTLSRLVRRPDGAALSARTRQLLEKLATEAPVVIITGRSVGDLRKRLGFELPYLIGNHGLEGLAGTKAALARAERHTKALKRAIGRHELDAGVEVEDKRYSLAVHYRQAADPSAARARLEPLLRRLKPAPRIVGGKFVFNLVQPDAPHKGTALLKLMKKLKTPHAVYVGDDDTDEDVFALGCKNILSIRVGKKRGSRARYYIERQSEINQLIRSLLPPR